MCWRDRIALESWLNLPWRDNLGIHRISASHVLVRRRLELRRPTSDTETRPYKAVRRRMHKNYGAVRLRRVLIKAILATQFVSETATENLNDNHRVDCRPVAAFGASVTHSGPSQQGACGPYR